MGPVSFCVLYRLLCQHDKSLQLCGINQAAGWLTAEATRLWSRSVETPHVLILSCSCSTCLPVEACLLEGAALSLKTISSNMTHTCTLHVYTWECVHGVWGRVGRLWNVYFQWPAVIIAALFSLNCQRLQKKSSSKLWDLWPIWLWWWRGRAEHQH